MNKHPKKLSEQILSTNPWWTYKHDNFELDNGESGEYFYGETPGNVMIVPVLPDGRLVLINQFRYLFDKYSLEFPCGGIKNDHVPEEMAKIELLEETGCQAEEFIKIGEFQPLNGIIKDRCHLFLAQVTGQVPQQLDATEEIEVLLRRPDELDEMIRKNEIWDGQTLAAWAMIHHKFLH
jgi:ADP-ribose pyrophosphatase